MGLCTILVGSPIEGFSTIGPFKTGDDAVQYAKRYVDEEWWILHLYAPVEEYETTK